MIKLYDGTKLTPNQFAKVAVARYGEGAYYWMERTDYEVSERDAALISEAVNKHMLRMEKFLLGTKLRAVYL